ncbi:hypothetical protein C0J45_13694 [Silurus meridionalis]|nr:hypothetical protein C0J45_13694 [Silurus meridionalis]
MEKIFGLRESEGERGRRRRSERRVCPVFSQQQEGRSSTLEARDAALRLGWFHGDTPPVLHEPLDPLDPWIAAGSLQALCGTLTYECINVRVFRVQGMHAEALGPSSTDPGLHEEPLLIRLTEKDFLEPRHANKVEKKMRWDELFFLAGSFEEVRENLVENMNNLENLQDILERLEENLERLEGSLESLEENLESLEENM